MAKHYEIKIKVAYDEAHYVPSTNELLTNVDRSVIVMLNNCSVGEIYDDGFEDRGVVESCSVEVEEVTK